MRFTYKLKKWLDFKYGSIFWFSIASVLSFSSIAFPAEDTQTSAYNFHFQSINGGRLELSSFKGNVILIVNTASFCGYTKQYSGLQKLWERYKSRGLVVLGTPSNDFGSQEPGSRQEIKEFCEVNFGINFPMTNKVKVRSRPQHPFYKWTSSKSSKFIEPGWNFHKYLISFDGSLVGSFPSNIRPLSNKMINAIERELEKSSQSVSSGKP